LRLKFLELPSDERRLYIGQAAARRNVPEVMLEKDFWVSWVLAVLFESRFGDFLVFKGGTSIASNPPAFANLGRLTLLMILSKFTQSNEHGGQPGV
jgi:hypothetical protein